MNQITSLTPARLRILSGSALKVVAMVVMLIDHIGAFLLIDYTPAHRALFTLWKQNITVYSIIRAVGRMAFPIYCFLLIEGFTYTHDRRKYGIRLALFALMSEFPWNYVHSGGLTYASQSVYVTLLLGYCGLCAIESLKRDLPTQIGVPVGLLVLSFLFKADYGPLGFGYILIVYMLRQHRPVQVVATVCCLSGTWKAGMAFIPISLYNGQRGFIRGWVTYVFYAFYPVHLLILGLIRFVCLTG